MNILHIRRSNSGSPQRRGFFIALLVLLSPIFSIAAESRTAPVSVGIYGTTMDTEGQTIPYVSLILQPEGEWVLSDEHGRFRLDPSWSTRDSVWVQRIGYTRTSVEMAQILDDRRIILEPVVLKGSAISVFSRPVQARSSSTISTFSRSETQGTINQSRMLSRVPGMTFKTYGGPAGISTLSLDGGPSSHMTVMVDDIDITSSQNGEADLSQLPLPYVSSLSYTPYDISQTGSGGTDGMIQMESGYGRSHITFSTGSFGHRAFDLGVQLPLTAVQTYFQIGQRHESANYPFQAYNRTGTRSNNSLDQGFVALRISKILSPSVYLKLSGMESHQSRGVAGLVWSPDTVSHRDDMLRLAGSSLTWIRTRGASHLRLNWRESREHYLNPGLALDSDHHLQSLTLSLEDEQRYSPYFSLQSTLNWHSDRINSSDAQEHHRQSLDGTMLLQIRLFDLVTFQPAQKIHHSPDLYSESFQDLQITVDLHTGPFRSLALSQGQVYHYPSFNDLYWKPGGNPDLAPEHSRITTVQTDLALGYLGHFKLQWQHKQSENLIQWMPVHSYWQPNNVLAATRESAKAVWQCDIQAWDLFLHAHHSWIKTLDESLDKALRYAPERTAAANLNWTPGPWEMNLNYHFVAERISMYSWPEDVVIPAAELWGASLGRSWQISDRQLILAFSIENLGDLDFETIRGYPEPGRSFRLTSTYQL